MQYISSLYSLQPILNLQLLVLKSLCSEMPTVAINNASLNYIKDIHLADPSFNTPGEIDVLLGADVFPLVLLKGRRYGVEGQPSALETVFGWVLIGPVEHQLSEKIQSCFVSLSNDSLNASFKRFWELEQISTDILVSEEDSQCEELFRQSHYREPSGRCVVSLLLKISEPIFKNSRDLALQRFYSLEHRFRKKPDLHKMYVNFMKDYQDSGHMSLISNSHNRNYEEKVYYIPHQAIIWPETIYQ